MLSTANTTSDYHGWLEMSVTEAVEKWLSDSSSNKGLYISAHAINKPEHEVRLDDIGLVNIKGNDEYQPFMVGYFKGQNIVKPTRLLRSKRNASKRRKKSEMRNPLIEHRLLENHKSCQIQTLYVSFKDLNWQVSPRRILYALALNYNEHSHFLKNSKGLDHCTGWIWCFLLQRRM